MEGKRKKVAMQPVVMVGEVARFQTNRLVAMLYDYAEKHGGPTMNEACKTVHEEKASRAEYEQLAQLLGYSVSGFGDISLARKRIKEEARKKVQRLIRKQVRRASVRPWSMDFDGTAGTAATLGGECIQTFELRSIEIFECAPIQRHHLKLMALAINGENVDVRYVGGRWRAKDKIVVHRGQRVSACVWCDEPVGVTVKLKGKVAV